MPKDPRDSVELFVAITRRRRGGWQAKCKMISCRWKETAATEILISKKWVQHFAGTHVAKWDGKS